MHWILRPFIIFLGSLRTSNDLSFFLSGSTTFSQCSGDDFEALIIRGGGTCLRNQPSASDVIGIPVCGNSRLEEGEECDCGKPEVQNNSFKELTLIIGHSMLILPIFTKW